MCPGRETRTDGLKCARVYIYTPFLLIRLAIYLTAFGTNPPGSRATFGENNYVGGLRVQRFKNKRMPNIYLYIFSLTE